MPGRYVKMGRQVDKATIHVGGRNGGYDACLDLYTRYIYFRVQAQGDSKASMQI